MHVIIFLLIHSVFKLQLNYKLKIYLNLYLKLLLLLLHESLCYHFGNFSVKNQINKSFQALETLNFYLGSVTGVASFR